jgi:hypothetical protein
MNKSLLAVVGGILISWSVIGATAMVSAGMLNWRFTIFLLVLSALGLMLGRRQAIVSVIAAVIPTLIWYAPILIGPEYVIEEPNSSALIQKYNHLSSSMESIAAQKGSCTDPEFRTTIRGALGTMRVSTVAIEENQVCVIYGYGPDNDDDGGRALDNGLAPTMAPFDRIPFPCLALVAVQGHCAPDGDFVIAEIPQSYFE